MIDHKKLESDTFQFQRERMLLAPSAHRMSHRWEWKRRRLRRPLAPLPSEHRPWRHFACREFDGMCISNGLLVSRFQPYFPLFPSLPLCSLVSSPSAISSGARKSERQMHTCLGLGPKGWQPSSVVRDLRTSVSRGRVTLPLGLADRPRRRAPLALCTPSVAIRGFKAFSHGTKR